jgi:hypothetical protein
MEVRILAIDFQLECLLTDHEVDSLIAVEIRNWILKELKSEISILDILSPMPIHILSTKISEGSKILPANLRLEIVEKKPNEEITANDEEKVAPVDDVVASSEGAVKIQVVSTNVVEIAIRPAADVEQALDITSAAIVNTSVEVAKSEVDGPERIISVVEIV